MHPSTMGIKALASLHEQPKHSLMLSQKVKNAIKNRHSPAVPLLLSVLKH